MFDFEDPSDLAEYEIVCDPDHPVGYDLDLTDWQDILLLIVLFCYVVALIVLLIVE